MEESVFEQEFQRQYKGLNKSQKLAVDTIEGPVMVIAGPGTGKTTILTLRIANILKETDTPPSGILALTFTESGVKSMKLKLRKIIGERADEVRIHTFHGFASSVISEFPEHFPHLSRSKQITDIEAGAMIRDILKDKKFSKLRPLGDPDFYVNKILSTIGDAKKEAESPINVRNFAKEEIERIKSDPNSLSSRGKTKGELKADALKKIDKCEKTILFSFVYEEYEKIKKENLRMDFDDLLYEFHIALNNDELLLRLLQEKFLYILVDEHQDTNDSQNLIVSKISSFFDNPNLFVVGDEKQAIYRFQGASVENFLKFQNLWKDMKLISLEDNYRSHQRILDAVYSMIEKNYEEDEHKSLRVKLRSGADHKEKPIDLVSAGNITSADNYLIEQIRKITQKEPDATVAVILRWNRDVDNALNLCRENNLEVSAERGVDIFSHPFGVIFFGLLEYFDDITNIEPLAFSIASGLWGLDFNKSVEVIRSLKSGNFDNLEKDIPTLSYLRGEILVSGPVSFLIQVGEQSKLAVDDRLKDPVTSEVWRAIIELAKDIAQSFNISDTKTLIRELINYKKTSENKVIKIGYGSGGSKVQIMTAHSSKGLEFDYVFIPYALEEYWMKKNFGSSFLLPKERDEGDSIKDARRLFYVSLTRAKKHAVIISPQCNDSGGDFIVLRFVDELDTKSVNKIELPALKLNPKVLSKEKIIEGRRNDLLEYSKKIILENGLSVTALNHYLECPSRFLYKSILKVPEAPNPVSEKGIAMHKAMSEVWKLDKKTKDNIKKIIDNVVRGYFEVSLLPKQVREIILEELLSDSESIAVSLLEHFNIIGDVFTDKWLEKKFEYVFKNEKYDLVLHGQMDVISSNESLVRVFDYKTKRSMSIPEIKGQTKSSDGNYFRQLVFYKILVESQKMFSDKKIETSLVFIKPDSKGQCSISSLEISKEDEVDLFNKVSTLLEDVFQGSFMDKKCADKDCKYCANKIIY